ncbi:PAN domain protein [Necator americanus]|uniref:PAN domain protein n=1 Tax=Necator americanus TaxID=51031 RepID=W2TCG9_NECAM|nr:PAN domain protein [Necator americanus]ETN79274.1 PAN domain protein [Necator americanus]
MEKLCISGHASEILTVSSEEECICECILAKVKRDIDCRSLLHYPEVQTSNCILNIHSRLTRSEYFMPELEYKVDYVQIPECARKAGGANLDSTVSNNREPLMSIDTRIVENDKDFGLPPGIGSVESEWSEWTTCDPKTSTHRRERLCTDCVEQIQIQPCFSNNNFDDILESFVTEQDKEISGVTAISQMIAENNKTADIEYFGPPFENLSPTWKSTFRRV